MRRYLIGEVCAALGLKPHVLRYWEQQIGILSPAKNRAGRRVYTPADLQTLFRVKYLVQQRLFTLEGAAQRIMEESGGRAADAKARIQQLRQELLDTLGRIRSADSLLATARVFRESSCAETLEAGNAVAAASAGAGAGGAAGTERQRGAGEREELPPQSEWLAPGFERRGQEERRRLRRGERIWAATARVRSFVRALGAPAADRSAAGAFRCRRIVWEDAARVTAVASGCDSIRVYLYRRAPMQDGRRSQSGVESTGTELAAEAGERLAGGFGLNCDIDVAYVSRSQLLPIPHLGPKHEPIVRRDCSISLYWSPLLSLLEGIRLESAIELLVLLPEEDLELYSTEELCRMVLVAARDFDAVALSAAATDATGGVAASGVQASGPLAIRSEALPGILRRLQPRCRKRQLERLILGEERDDNESVEVVEYRASPTTVLGAAERPIVLQRGSEATAE